MSQESVARSRPFELGRADSHALAKLVGLLLFARDLTVGDPGIVCCRVPRAALQESPLRAVHPGSDPNDERGEVEVRIVAADQLLRLISATDGGIVVGLPPRYVMAPRTIVVSLLQGALLASPLQPSGGGGWQVTCPSSERALALAGLLRRCGISGRPSDRAGRQLVKIPVSEAEGLLALDVCLPTLAAVARPRTPTGQATLDEINAHRRADQEQRTCRALEVLGEQCPASLREAAELRIRHPQLSVEALGKMMRPPLSRHAVNGQLRRLHQLAARVTDAAAGSIERSA